jgi:omega-6 fatty acid desaturase (delta-12 desaturase)
MKATTNNAHEIYQGWQKIMKEYQQPDVKISVWQIINSVGGLLLCWVLMYFSLRVGYWLTLLLSIPAAGFVVRIFIIQHDCGHMSFFKSRKANDIVGSFCSIFTFTPYKYWRKSHAIHHATHADLEDRGTGDIWTLTVTEYFESSAWRRFFYRIFRNPIFLFGIAPVVNFVIIQRINYTSDWKNGENQSVWLTNFALLGLFALGAWIMGLGNWLSIQLPIIAIAASAGTWLFYVQHQFEHTYWEHTPEWNYTLAAMHGSSYYKLPLILQWFTGNIGFHHIHHLSPKIPNYKLSKVHYENEMMQQVVELTLWSSLKTINLALWDEEKDRLISFGEAMKRRRLA